MWTIHFIKWQIMFVVSSRFFMLKSRKAFCSSIAWRQFENDISKVRINWDFRSYNANVFAFRQLLEILLLSWRKETESEYFGYDNNHRRKPHYFRLRFVRLFFFFSRSSSLLVTRLIYPKIWGSTLFVYR